MACLLAPVAPAQAAGSEYVALGDSYSSGTGTGSYLADGSGCLRSLYAYPSLIAASGGHALNFRACSGATIPDVIGSQVSALTGSTARSPSRWVATTPASPTCSPSAPSRAG